jgi:hypothetical protein
MGNHKRFTEIPNDVVLWEELLPEVRNNPVTPLANSRRCPLKSIQKEISLEFGLDSEFCTHS